MTVKYTVTALNCPACDNVLTGGQRKFGPAQIRCGKCGATLSTDLEAWDDLTLGRKITVTLNEIILPSWLSVSVLPALLVQFFLCAMAQVPFGIVLSILDPNTESVVTFIGLGCISPLIYPAILLIRVGFMVRESRAFTRDGTIPVWGKPKSSEQEEGAVPRRYENNIYPIVLRLFALGFALVWFRIFTMLIYGPPLLATISGSLNRWLLSISMVLVHLVGGVLAFELQRSLGHTKTKSRVVAGMIFFLAPIVLPLVALLSRRREVQPELQEAV